MIDFGPGKIQRGEIALRAALLLHHRNEVADRNLRLLAAPKRFEEAVRSIYLSSVIVSTVLAAHSTTIYAIHFDQMGKWGK